MPKQCRSAALKKKPWNAFPKLSLRYRIYEETLYIKIQSNWSQWPHGLRRGSVAVRLLGLKVPIPPGAWMSVSCECCVLWVTGLCDGSIRCPEESYGLCVCVCARVCACARVCVSLPAIGWNNNPLHIRQVGRRCHTEEKTGQAKNCNVTMRGFRANTVAVEKQ
jgi:hypothetical protein